LKSEENELRSRNKSSASEKHIDQQCIIEFRMNDDNSSAMLSLFAPRLRLGRGHQVGEVDRHHTFCHTVLVLIPGETVNENFRF